MCWIDNARFLAVLAVVAIHAASTVIETSPVESESWWIGVVVDAASRWSVPAFVAISGALMLVPGHQQTVRQFYLRRAARIMLPMLAWSAFYIAWAHILPAIKGKPAPAVAQSVGLLISGRPYYHLWYLYMLVGLYLVMPVLQRYVASVTVRTLRVSVAVLLAAGALYTVARYTVLHNDIWITWGLAFVPYALLGDVVACAPAPRMRAMLLAGFVVSAASAVALYAAGAHAGSVQFSKWATDYLGVAVIPMSVCAILILRAAERPVFPFTAQLAAASFGIYLIHPAVIDLWQLTRFWPGAWPAYVSIPAITMGAAGISLVATRLLLRTPFLRHFV